MLGTQLFASATAVLVVCPSSLQVQWRDEMRDKFGLEFRIIDSETISQLRANAGSMEIHGLTFRG